MHDESHGNPEGFAAQLAEVGITVYITNVSHSFGILLRIRRSRFVQLAALKLNLDLDLELDLEFWISDSIQFWNSVRIDRKNTAELRTRFHTQFPIFARFSRRTRFSSFPSFVITAHWRDVLVREYMNDDDKNFRKSRETEERVASREPVASQMAAGDPLAQFRPVRSIPLHRCTLLHLAWRHRPPPTTRGCTTPSASPHPSSSPLRAGRLDSARFGSPLHPLAAPFAVHRPSQRKCMGCEN